MDGSNWSRVDQYVIQRDAPLRSSAGLAAVLLGITLALAVTLTMLGVRATSEFDVPEQPVIIANGS